MKYQIFIYLSASMCIFGKGCTVSVQINGPWYNGPDPLFCVDIESKDYENFNNLKKTIVECFNKEPDKYLKSFINEVKNNNFWDDRFKQIKNLKEFIENKVSLEDFLKDKAIQKVKLCIDIEEIKIDPLAEYKKNPDNFPRYDLTNVTYCKIVFMSSPGRNIVLKDLYSIKDEYKDCVNVLIKYLEDHKLSYSTLYWLEEHKLDKYFKAYDEGGKRCIGINNEYKDPNKPKTSDYKDIVIVNGEIDKSDKYNDKEIDKNNENIDKNDKRNDEDSKTNDDINKDIQCCCFR